MLNIIIVREMQINNIVYHFIRARLATIKKLDSHKC